MTEHLLPVVLDWRQIERKVNYVIIFSNRKNTTFRPKKRLREDFFGENVFIRPRSHKSDPIGNTGKLKKYQTMLKNRAYVFINNNLPPYFDT